MQDWAMMQRLHCSWQELQDLPGGLRQIFDAIVRGEHKGRERARGTQD